MAIAIGATGLGTRSGGDTSVVLSVGGTPVAGGLVVVGVVLKDTTLTVNGFNDDSTGGPMSFTQLVALNVSTTLRVELWATAVGGSKGNFSFLLVNTSGTVNDGAGCFSEYSGVGSLGPSSSANNTTADPTISVTTQDNNNWVHAFFGSLGATLPTSKTGTLDRANASAGVNPVASAETHNSSATPASVTNAVTLAATTWAALAVELRTGTALSRTRMLLGVG